jgi:hypothetical protein
MNHFFAGFVDELVKVANAQMGYGLSQPPSNVSPGGGGGGGMSYGTGLPPKKEEMLTGPRMSYKAPAAVKAPAVGNKLKLPSAPKRLTAGLGMAKSRTGTLIPRVTAGPKLAPKREEMLAGGAPKPKPGVDAPLDPYKSKAKARVAQGVKPRSGERTTGWQKHLRKAKAEGTEAFAKAKAGKKGYLAANPGSQRYSGGGAKSRVAQGAKSKGPSSDKAKAAQGTHDRRVAYMKSHGGTLEGFKDKAKAQVAKDVKPKGGKSGGKERDYGYASFGSTRKGHAGEGRGPKIYGKELQTARKKLLDDFATEDRTRSAKKESKTPSYKRDVASIQRSLGPGGQPQTAGDVADTPNARRALSTAEAKAKATQMAAKPVRKKKRS